MPRIFNLAVAILTLWYCWNEPDSSSSDKKGLQNGGEISPDVPVIEFPDGEGSTKAVPFQVADKVRDEVQKKYKELYDGVTHNSHVRAFWDGVGLGLKVSETKNLTASTFKHFWEEVVMKHMKDHRDDINTSSGFVEFVQGVSERRRNRLFALLASFGLVFAVRKATSGEGVNALRWSDQIVDADDRELYGIREQNSGPFGKGGAFPHEGLFLRDRILDFAAMATSPTPPPNSPRTSPGRSTARSQATSPTVLTPVAVDGGPTPANTGRVRGEGEGEGEDSQDYSSMDSITTALESAASCLSIRCEALGAFRWHGPDKSSRIRYCKRLHEEIENLRSQVVETFGEKVGKKSVTEGMINGVLGLESQDRIAKELCLQALVISQARFADAILRSTRDALLVSIEYSLLPRLDRWMKHRRQLERNYEFYRNFRLVFRTTEAMQKAFDWVVGAPKWVLTTITRPFQWRKARDRDAAAQEKNKRNRQRHMRYKKIFSRRAGRLSQTGTSSPAALASSPSSSSVPHPERKALIGDLPDKIERCELAIEYLQRVMRHQLNEIGSIQRQLWNRPRDALPIPTQPSVGGRPPACSGPGLRLAYVQELNAWSGASLEMCQKGLRNPVVDSDVTAELRAFNGPAKMPSLGERRGDKESSLSWAEDSTDDKSLEFGPGILKQTLKYGANVDMCLKANDELRLTTRESVEKYVPTLITLTAVSWLQSFFPASPRDLFKALNAARNTMTYIWKRHVMRPARAIINDLLFQTRPKLLNPGSIDDARSSLQHMMRDFAKKNYRKMNETELEKRIEELDMSLISTQYNKQVANTMLNLFTGKIPQSVLIQVQFLKLEMLATMEAVDDLYGANQINLQLLASIPALLASFFFIRLSLRLLWATSTRRIATEEYIHSKMREHLREVERNLILRSRLDGHVSDTGYGKMILESWRFSRTLETYWAYFHPSVRGSLRADLSDLMASGLADPDAYSDELGLHRQAEDDLLSAPSPEHLASPTPNFAGESAEVMSSNAATAMSPSPPRHPAAAAAAASAAAAAPRSGRDTPAGEYSNGLAAPNYHDDYTETPSPPASKEAALEIDEVLRPEVAARRNRIDCGSYTAGTPPSSMSAWHRLRICERLRQSYRFLGKSASADAAAGKLPSYALSSS